MRVRALAWGPVRTGPWLGTGALVVLAARALAYALAPAPSVRSLELERQVGGPRLVVVSLVSIGLALALASAVVGVAALAVRERRLLEGAPLVEEPRLRPVRLAGRAVVLWAASSLAFALLESYLHRRAGLGWHGLECLVGPVHRDAIPLLAGLSLLAAALFSALELLLAWMRRTIALVRARTAPGRVRERRRPASPPLCPGRPSPLSANGPRGPPTLWL